MEGDNATRNAEKAVSDILRDGVMKSQPRDNATAAPRRMTSRAISLRDAAATCLTPAGFAGEGVASE